MPPPFRVEHVGSLLRPDYLLEARKQFEKQEITREQLREIEDRAIIEAINLQREVGIKGITDGEYRRHVFYDGFFEYLEGFEEIHNPPFEIYKPYVPNIRFLIASRKAAPQGNGTQYPLYSPHTKPSTAILCTGKIKYVKSGYLPQFEALKILVRPDEVKNIKLTITAPEWLHLRHGEYAFAPGVYSGREDYFNDIAAAYRQELNVLYTAGCRHVQIDDPILAFFCDLPMLQGLKEEGEDPNVLLDAYVRVYNNCLATRPRDMTISLHICRGNYRSMHFSEGGYDAIAIKLLNDVNVDCYYLEYDTPRAGTFEPLKYLPKHKSVVLGIITSKFPELEDKEQLKERVLDAARVVASGAGETVEEALQRISVSPQCGFASHEEGNRLTVVDMRRKLELVRDVATSVWGEACSQ